MPSGMLPVKEFEERLSDTKLVICVMEFGTAPVREFESSDKEVMLDHIPISDGMEPARTLLLMLKDFIFEK
jgi:hypothetical protein